MAAHNWMTIDVNGWPVANQGGDCAALSYPLYEIAKRISNVEYINHAIRHPIAFQLSDVQFCITGFGLENNNPNDQNLACISLNNQEEGARMFLMTGVPANTNNNQNNSVYQNWLQNGDITLDPLGLVKQAWTNDDLWGVFETLNDNGQDLNVGSPYARTLVANMGVASGVWNSSRLDLFIGNTGNKELYLINALLRNETPLHSQSLYKGYLDVMGAAGPFNLTTWLEGTDGLKKNRSKTDGDQIYAGRRTMK